MVQDTENGTPMLKIFMKPYPPGDVNHDGEVNIADVNVIIKAMLTGNGMEEDLDVNGDGEVNIADVNAVINIILQGDR